MKIDHVAIVVKDLDATLALYTQTLGFECVYREIVAELAKDPGVRPEDVVINLVEVLPENWSFGNGIAQYALA